MKTGIHPTWHPQAQVRCACGNEFTVGSVLPEIHVDVCSHCHPFFTGQARYVDTAGRVEKFAEKQKIAAKKTVSKKERRSLKKRQKLEEELSRPASLEEVRGAR